MKHRLASVADRVLEATVVGSFTNLGFKARRRLFDWGDEPSDLTGRWYVVTGANSGLGLATSTELAVRGASVTLVARNPERGESARRRIVEGTGNPDVDLVLTDLSDLAAVRRLAAELRDRDRAIDALVHNAGALVDEREVTPEGLELTFATHVAGPHLLNLEVLDSLQRGSRVVFVASGGMYTQGLHLDDLQFEKGEFSGVTAYARAKRMQVVLAREWARRVADRGIIVQAMHPGWADTPGIDSSLPRFRRAVGPLLRTPREGADTIVWLATSDKAEASGLFWHDRRPRPTVRLPGTSTTEAEQLELWERCTDLVGFTGSVPSPG